MCQWSGKESSRRAWNLLLCRRVDSVIGIGFSAEYTEYCEEGLHTNPAGRYVRGQLIILD